MEAIEATNLTEAVFWVLEKLIFGKNFYCTHFFNSQNFSELPISTLSTLMISTLLLITTFQILSHNILNFILNGSFSFMSSQDIEQQYAGISFFSNFS
jgi:hypothetical protein